MELRIFVVEDGDNVINKTMADVISININLKRDVDISNPSIILLDGIGVNYSAFNYAQIVELDRYYFVENVQRLNSKMIQMDMRCDVLETYKADILASMARFYRNIKSGDYLETNIDYSSNKVVTKFESNKSLISGESSMIMSTIGGKSNG